MAVFEAVGGPHEVLDSRRKAEIIRSALKKITRDHDTRNTLAVVPDFTRRHSGAGEIVSLLYAGLPEPRTFHLLPALGTHQPMTDKQVAAMYGGVPCRAVKVHNWRTGLKQVGVVPGRFVGKVSGGKVDYDIPVAIDRLVVEGGYTSVFSIGQVVPHEVTGMANGVKNILVGAGGRDFIDRTHFLGALCDIETIMGRIDTPVRRVFNYAHERFLARLGIIYILTVVADDGGGRLVTRGLFAGDDLETFALAARLSQKVNIKLLAEPPVKVVVWLDPAEFQSIWLGNKAVYRTRMAVADGGEIIVLAPGVRTFGEDPVIDGLIRKYGYRGTPATLEAVRNNEDLRQCLSAAAHLIHGSSEGRFSITYCTGSSLMPGKDVERVGYQWMEIGRALARYDPQGLTDGHNPGVHFVRHPGMGLWALARRFA